MNIVDRLLRLAAPNGLHAALYPRPAVDFRFRPYDDRRDRGRVVDLHDSNAPDRFPENHRPKFEAYLDSGPVSFFVAETAQGKVIACGGIGAVGDRVNIPCYGLVAREHQGMGVGSASILARLAFATRTPGLNCSVIFAVPKSVGFYRRLGYAEWTRWDGGDGQTYPAAALTYYDSALIPIRQRLKKRNLLIDPTWPLGGLPGLKAVFEEIPEAGVQIHLVADQPNRPADPGAPNPPESGPTKP